MTRARKRNGFTLLEVIIAVAIVAIIAGAIGPVAYKQINRAKQDATAKELETIRTALLAYYEDTGSFPSAGEALDALVRDTGNAAWRGPYMAASSSDPLREISTDAFGQSYIYDPSPTVIPQGFADVVVASGGANRRLDLTGGSTSPSCTWNLERSRLYDDVFVTLSAAPLVREKRDEALSEIKALGEASKHYYRINSRFPANLGQLAGDFIDPGFENDTFSDGWRSDYLSRVRGGNPSILSIWSCGANRHDESGGGDDLALEISSAPLDLEAGEEESGESETEREVRVAQSALDAYSGEHLIGRWPGERGMRGRLGLGSEFDYDQWGRSYEVDYGSNKVYSCGPDGQKRTTADNIPPGVGP